MTAAVVALTLTLASSGVDQADVGAATLSQAHAFRRELAGWLRGTSPCSAGRVARHLAQLLRQQGVAAEFHRAGHAGGYTVARLGPAELAPRVLLVASLDACPQPPDNRQLEWDAPARPVWRAAALAAALVELKSTRLDGNGLLVLFLAGDGDHSHGRRFVDDTLPELARGAPILDEGGAYLASAGDSQLLLATRWPRQVEMALRVDPAQPQAADNLDRALAVAERYRLELPAAEPSADSGTDDVRYGSDPGPDPLRVAQCRVLERQATHQARLTCNLPPQLQVQDLAFALYRAVRRPGLSIGYQRSEYRKQPEPPAAVLRAVQSASRALGRITVIHGAAELPPGDTHQLQGSQVMGCEFFASPRTQPGGDLRDFERGTLFARALLHEMLADGFDEP